MQALRLEGIEKIFPGGHVAVAGVDLEVQKGEMLALLGPSGCGKSTLLRIVAGIETPTRGRVWIDGRDVTELPPQTRDVAMVFQNYALYPHLSVKENLSFGLRMRKVPREQVGRRVREIAASLGIDALLDRKPAQLSGGQRQRVALGRAIARSAKVFLLDEPLSNLDVQLRVTTRMELARLHRDLGVPMVYVTHDQEEAMTLGDRIAVLQAGRLLQIGTPLEIYARPASRFVGGFVGSPRMNFVPGRVGKRDGGMRLDFLGFTVALARAAQSPPSSTAPAARSDAAAQRDVVVGIRPEDLEIVEPGAGAIRARADVIESLGRETLVHVLADGDGNPATELRVLAPGDTALRPGAALGLRPRPDRIHLFDPATEQRIEPLA